MKVFISHSSVDQVVAASLVQLLRIALAIRAQDIRCTSVEGHTLPIGADFADQLREEVDVAEVLLALVTPASLKSTFVLFELGARWGAKRPLLTLRVGVSPKSLPSILAARHSADGAIESDVEELLRAVASLLKTEIEQPPAYKKWLYQFVALVRGEIQDQSLVSTESPAYKEAEKRDEGLINFPEDRSSAQQYIRVSGILSALQPDSRAWLLVIAPNGRVYPQMTLARQLGPWVANAHIGRVGAGKDTGFEYTLILVGAGVSTSYLFERSVRGDDDGDGLPRSAINANDIHILDSRRVVRVD